MFDNNFIAINVDRFPKFFQQLIRKKISYTFTSHRVVSVSVALGYILEHDLAIGGLSVRLSVTY